MPAIRITDSVGANVDVTLAPASTLVKYVKGLPAALLQGGDLSRLALLTLNDPAVNSLHPALTFQQPFALSEQGPALTIRADAGASFRVIAGPALFSPDEYGDNIEIENGRCYVALGLDADAGLGVGAAAGAATFGIDVGTGAAVTSYRPFSAAADAPTLLDAIRDGIGGFILPSDVDDLAGLTPGTVVTVDGHGTLRLSGSANLLAIVNPLATLALPGPAPALSVMQGGSVTVGASWAISAEYRLRIQKVGPRRVRLGWYRKHASDVAVTASAEAGISAGTKTVDLFPTLLGAISSSAHADLAELQNAGLTPEQGDVLSAAVKGAIDRKLQVGIAAEWGALATDEAAFLYEVDLDALDAAGEAAVHAALHGNLGGIGSANGVVELRSILTKAKASHFSVRVNLLGIFNFSSIAKLAVSGTVTFTPSTGELVISDQATAERIRSESVNFGVDEHKLRKVMAESFLITAAYRSSNMVVAPPQLSSSHVFFSIDDRVSREDLRRFAAIAPALSLAPAEIPAAVQDFGRTSVLAEASYNAALSRSLFLRLDGSPRPLTDYETAGRRALTLLVLPDGDDAFRRAPALDDGLWNRMTDLGPANFHQLFPAEHIPGIQADYVAIRWWTESMAQTAAILARIGPAAPDDPSFQKLRGELATHLRDVAAKAHAQFGAPWGLVAMFLLTGKGGATLDITGARFAYTACRGLSATA